MLRALHPMPAAGTTTARLSIATGGVVRASVFDATGRRVETLFSGFLQAGEHNIQWNTTRHAAGVYYLRVVTNERTMVQSVVVAR